MSANVDSPIFGEVQKRIKVTELYVDEKQEEFGGEACC